MRTRRAILVGAVVGSIVLPMLVGATRAQFTRLGFQTHALAHDYYHEIVDGLETYQERRDKFISLASSPNHRILISSECEKKLIYSFFDREKLVGEALLTRKSEYLEEIFDEPGFDAIEALPSTALGALQGCRHTILVAACDAWGRDQILQANKAKEASLQKKREEWLRRNEAASCNAVEKIYTPVS